MRVSFNSLFEMHQLNGWGIFCINLSILYLRCFLGPQPPGGGVIFNFQFSIWDARRGGAGATLLGGDLFQFSIWDAPVFLRGFGFGGFGCYFQFSIWDADVIERLRLMNKPGSPFNSLFEMLCFPRRLKAQPAWRLSILYLRCRRLRHGLTASGSGLTFNSLFEMLGAHGNLHDRGLRVFQFSIWDAAPRSRLRRP